MRNVKVYIAAIDGKCNGTWCYSMQKRGRIEVTGKITSDHIAEISICDNGNGIGDEMLQRLHQELKKDLQQGVNHSSSGIGLINVHQRIKTIMEKNLEFQLKVIKGNTLV